MKFEAKLQQNRRKTQEKVKPKLASFWFLLSVRQFFFLQIFTKAVVVLVHASPVLINSTGKQEKGGNEVSKLSN